MHRASDHMKMWSGVLFLRFLGKERLLWGQADAEKYAVSHLQVNHYTIKWKK